MQFGGIVIVAGQVARKIIGRIEMGQDRLGDEIIFGLRFHKRPERIYPRFRQSA